MSESTQQEQCSDNLVESTKQTTSLTPSEEKESNSFDNKTLSIGTTFSLTEKTIRDHLESATQTTSSSTTSPTVIEEAEDENEESSSINRLSIENVFSLSDKSIEEHSDIEKILSAFFDIIPENEEKTHKFQNNIIKRKRNKRKNAIQMKKKCSIPLADLIPEMKLNFNQTEMENITPASPATISESITPSPTISESITPSSSISDKISPTSLETLTENKMKIKNLKKEKKSSYSVLKRFPKGTNNQLMFRNYRKKIKEIKNKMKRLRAKIKKTPLTTRNIVKELSVDVSPPPLVHYRDDKPGNLEAPPELSPQPAFLQNQNNTNDKNQCITDDEDDNNDEQSYREDIERFKPFFTPELQKKFEEDILLESDYEDDIKYEDEDEEENVMVDDVLLDHWLNEPELANEEIYESPQKISTGKEERETIDGLEILSFRTQKDMDEFTRIEQDYRGITAPVDDGYDLSYDEIDPMNSFNYPGSASSCCSSTSQNRHQVSDGADDDDGFESCGVRGIHDENSLDFTWLSDTTTTTTAMSTATTTTTTLTSSSSTFVPISISPSTSNLFTTGRPIPISARMETNLMPPLKIKVVNSKLKTYKLAPTSTTTSSSDTILSSWVNSNPRPSTSRKSSHPYKRRLFSEANEKSKSRPRIKRKISLPKDLDTNFNYIWNSGRVMRLTGSSKNFPKPTKIPEIFENKDYFINETQKEDLFKETDEKEKEIEEHKKENEKSESSHVNEISKQNLNSNNQNQNMKINIIVKPEIGVKLGKFALKCLSKCKNKTIDESFAKFAVSTVIIPEKRKPGRKPKIIPPPPTPPPTEDIILEMGMDQLNFDFYSLYQIHVNELVIKDVMSKMLDAIDISHNPPAIDFDPDQIRSTHDDVYPEMKMNNDLIKDNLISKNKNRRFQLEMKRLDADLIFMPENEKVNNHDETQPCTKEHCRLGCVCSSLNYERPQLLEHCGQINCLYECSCKEHKNTSTNRLTLLSGSSTLASTITSTSTATNKLLAPLEKEFKQTVIFNDNSTMVVGRRKREIKLPERFRDSVLGREFAISELKLLGAKANSNEDVLDSKSSCIVPQYVPVEILFPLKSSPTSKPQNLFKQFLIKQSTCVLSQDDRLTGLWVWCMIHKCYGCSCITYRPTKNLPIDLNQRPDRFVYQIKHKDKNKEEEEEEEEEEKEKEKEKEKKISQVKIEEIKRKVEQIEELKNENENARKIQEKEKEFNIAQIRNENSRLYNETVTCTAARIRLRELDYAQRNVSVSYLETRERLLTTRNIKPMLIENISVNDPDSVDVTAINDSSNKSDELFIKFSFLSNTKNILKSIKNIITTFDLKNEYNILDNKESPYTILNWSYLQSVIKDEIYTLWKKSCTEYGDILLLTGLSQKDDSPYIVNINDWIPNILSFPPKEYYQLRTNESPGLDVRRFAILTNCNSEISALRLIGYIDISKHFYNDQLITPLLKFKMCMNEALLLELERLENSNSIKPLENNLESQVNELLFHVPLPKVSTQCRWYMVSLNQDFDLLVMRKYSQGVTFNELIQAITYGSKTKRTIRIPVNKQKTILNISPIFGIFALPDVFTRVFIGPYEMNEPSCVELYVTTDGKHEKIPANAPRLTKNRINSKSNLDRHIETILSVLNNKFNKQSIGTWLNTKPEEKEYIPFKNSTEISPLKQESRINIDSVLTTRVENKFTSSKFKRMMICAIHWPEVGYFEARLYDNITYRIVHPETQVELRFTGHINLFLWLNMFVKLELEWGIQNFPRTKPYLKPFDIQNFEEIRKYIVEQIKMVGNKRQKILLPKTAVPKIVTSINMNSVLKPLELSTFTTMFPSATTIAPTAIVCPITSNTTTTTSSTTTSTTINTATTNSSSSSSTTTPSSISHIPTKTTPKIISLPTKASSIISSSSPKTVFKPIMARKSSSTKKDQVLLNNTFEEDLIKLANFMYPLNDKEKLKDIIIKLYDTILEEERKEFIIDQNRSKLYNDRERNIFQIYDQAPDIKNKAVVNKVLSELSEILKKKIPKQRLNTHSPYYSEKEIKNNLYRLLKKIDPSIRIESTNFENNSNKVMKIARTQSPVSITLVPLTKETSQASNKISTSSSSSATTTTTSSAITTTSVTSAASTSITKSTIKKLEQELDDDVTVTFISSENKTKKEQSIPYLDLTKFSDEEANDSLIVQSKENKKFGLAKNNQISIESINSSSRTTAATATTSSSQFKLNIPKNNQTNENTTTTTTTTNTATATLSPIQINLLQNSKSDESRTTTTLTTSKPQIKINVVQNSKSDESRTTTTLTTSKPQIKINVVQNSKSDESRTTTTLTTSKPQIKINVLRNNKTNDIGQILSPDGSIVQWKSLSKSQNIMKTKPKLLSNIDESVRSLISKQRGPYGQELPTPITIKRASSTITSAQQDFATPTSTILTTLKRPISTITSPEFATSTPITIKRASSTITSAQQDFATAAPTILTTLKRPNSTITSAEFATASAATPINIKRASSTITSAQQDFATATAATSTTLKRPNSTITCAEQKSLVATVPPALLPFPTGLNPPQKKPKIILESLEEAPLKVVKRKATKPILFRKKKCYATILKKSKLHISDVNSDTDPTPIKPLELPKNLTVREILDLQKKNKLTNMSKRDSPTPPPAATKNNNDFNHLRDITRNTNDGSGSPSLLKTLSSQSYLPKVTSDSSLTITLTRASTSTTNTLTKRDLGLNAKQNLSISLVAPKPTATQPSILKKSSSSSSISTIAKSPPPLIFRKKSVLPTKSTTGSAEYSLLKNNVVIPNFSLNSNTLELKPISSNLTKDKSENN